MEGLGVGFKSRHDYTFGVSPDLEVEARLH